MRKRLTWQKTYAKRIVQGISEVDFAKERFQRLKKEKIDRRNEIMSSKLKPKGHEILKKEN